MNIDTHEIEREVNQYARRTAELVYLTDPTLRKAYMDGASFGAGKLLSMIREQVAAKIEGEKRLRTVTFVD